MESSVATTSTPEFETSSSSKSNIYMGLSESSRVILAWVMLGTVTLCYVLIVALLYRKISKNDKKKKKNINNNNENKKHEKKNETNPKDGEDDHDVAIEIENTTQGIGGISGSQGLHGSQTSQQHSARAQCGTEMSFRSNGDGDIYSMNMNQMAIQQRQLASRTETTQDSMKLREGEGKREITLFSQSSDNSNNSNSSNNGNLGVMNNRISSVPRNNTMTSEHISAPWSIGMKINGGNNNSVNDRLIICGDESGDSGNDISVMLNQTYQSVIVGNRTKNIGCN